MEYQNPYLNPQWIFYPKILRIFKKLKVEIFEQDYEMTFKNLLSKNSIEDYINIICRKIKDNWSDGKPWVLTIIESINVNLKEELIEIQDYLSVPQRTGEKLKEDKEIDSENNQGYLSTIGYSPIWGKEEEKSKEERKYKREIRREGSNIDQNETESNSHIHLYNFLKTIWN